jgi:hypothetical protein
MVIWQVLVHYVSNYLMIWIVSYLTEMIPFHLSMQIVLNIPLQCCKNNVDEITTSLWKFPLGAPQTASSNKSILIVPAQPRYNLSANRGTHALPVHTINLLTSYSHHWCHPPSPFLSSCRRIKQGLCLPNQHEFVVGLFRAGWRGANTSVVVVPGRDGVTCVQSTIHWNPRWM